MAAISLFIALNYDLGFIKAEFNLQMQQNSD